MGNKQSKHSKKGKGHSKHEERYSADDAVEETPEYVLPNANHTPFEDSYKKEKLLGSGAFGSVYKAVRKSDGLEVAAKCIAKKRLEADENDKVCLLREIEIMQKLDHPHVLKLYEVFENEEEFVLVIELVEGEELFTKIINKGSFSEDEAKDIVRQIMSGLKYMHDQQVCHRDLKPENLLCRGSSTINVKIADFGLSKISVEGDRLKTACGTPDYVAPEIINNEGAYSFAVDMWSMGVITYILLCGAPPFYHENLNGLFRVIQNGKYEFYSPDWDDISAEAKDFVRRLLIVDPRERMTAEQSLNHPWIKASKPSMAARPSVMNFAKFSEYNKKRNQQRM